MSEFHTMPDGTLVSGPSEILQALYSVYERNQKINNASKYHACEIVRIKDSVREITESLMPTYNYYDAYAIASILAGKKVEIISPDILTDSSGTPGTYYTVEAPEGLVGFYVLPEHLIEGDTRNDI